MSIVKMDSETIAEIKNALCVISLNADLITPRAMRVNEIKDQVKRIDKMLPG